jgi:NTE family protein
MTKNALILGGGGVLGIGWEIGVLKGLHEAGADVTGADLIVGTSAGSVVGTRIAQGSTIDELVAEQYAPSDGMLEEAMAETDLPNLVTIFQKWANLPKMTRETCAEVGALALASKTTTEDKWLEWFESTLRSEWPARDLRVTAVDAESGEFRVWTRDSGVDIRRAVASSCTVPGIFPCVTIDGHRYQDGGVRSGTSADLAQGYDDVVIIAPIGSGSSGIDPLLGRMTNAETEALRAAGSNVELLYPDAATLEVFGINRMDSTRRGDAVEAGAAQGRELAMKLASSWSKAPA